MTTAIIHLSDLHFRQGWVENLGVVLDEFFKDLGQQIEKIKSSNVYLAFSGDIVQAGANSKLYDEFIFQFDSKLKSLNITKSHRICVPGNHDVSIDQISAKIIEHKGVVSQKLNESQFNDYVSKPSNVLTDKFTEYCAFENRFADFGVFDSTITGAGWKLAEDIGLYCLNTALCGSGGLKGEDGEVFADKGRLAIDTRSLQLWNLNCKARWKILVMHHPVDWLVDWAQRELKNILSKNFALCLSGHAHEQTTHHSVSQATSLVECSAPPLFTNKNDDLGYSIISICPNRGVTDITYRQWTKHRSFVAGVNFSNTDDGKVRISEPEKIKEITNPDQKAYVNFVDRYLTKKFDEALESFPSQPKVWVEPVLGKVAEVLENADSESKVDLSVLISNPKSTIIKAPPQFGLTCLSHYLIREAWRSQESSLWLYLDSKTLKPHTNEINKAVKTELNLLGSREQDIKCVILDSWTSLDNKAHKLLQKVCTLFRDVPVIVMHTIDDTRILIQEDGEDLDREFEVLYLWALPRGHVRKVVTEYNEKKHIGDENSVIKKVVSDLEVLNLHRTPLNCLTLLKVSEIDFDESPVNRTELIKRVLFLLFNVDDIPTYKVRPDLKDCEYVLGYFCETMLRNDDYYFTREKFLDVLQKFCEERIIDLEVQVVFDVLYKNNILIKRGSLFCFRYTYWIYYFAAQRMHHDQNFTNFIYEGMKYANYPELIEFYTGIDRRREDALRFLIKDIRIACDEVKMKCGFHDELNPYRLAQWCPSEETLKQMKDEICNDVLSSKLPDSVKDHYADRHYDRTRPYFQDIRNIVNNYSFVFMMQATKAGARALRNSDYVDPDIKLDLLREIMRSWEQTLKVLLILGPLLASKGNAIFDGVAFFLNGKFGDTPDERLPNILKELPINIVSWFENDLYSAKMGPLLTKQLVDEDNALKKHKLILMLIMRRPREWKKHVQRYIASVKKNSFYLFDVHRMLCAQYCYSYASARSLSDIEYLIKMAIAKHECGSKEPGAKLIKKVNDKVLPVRVVEQDS